MKFLILLATLFTVQAHAQSQFIDGEKDGSNKFKILGREFYPSAYSLASVESDKRESGGRLSTYNYASASSFIKGDYKFIFRQPFTYGTAGTDRFNGGKNNPQEFQLQDTILEIRNPTLAYIPWDVGLFWTGRVYLPVSKFSKEIGQVARFRNQLAFSKMLSSHFLLVYDQRTFYSWQSRTTYRNQFEDEYGMPVDTTSLTKRWEVQHWLTLWAKTGPESGLGWGLKLEDTFWNKSEAENRYREPERLIFTGPQARFPFSDSVSFILSFEDKVDRNKNNHELGQFLAKNTQWVLHSFINF